MFQERKKLISICLNKKNSPRTLGDGNFSIRKYKDMVVDHFISMSFESMVFWELWVTEQNSPQLYKRFEIHQNRLGNQEIKLRMLIYKKMPILGLGDSVIRSL